MEQNTPEWLAMRKGKIGASDAPIIMKVSPWKTPYELWKEKLSLAESQSNFAMERGTQMEPIARKALEDKLGMPLQAKIKLHSERSWMMASMDAVSFDERTVAEIKCPGKADHELAMSGQVPEKYFPQLQHQMEVCNVAMVYYFSYHEETNALIKVYRDDKYIKELITQEEKFFECLKNFETPPLMDRDYTHHTDVRWAKLVERLQEIKRLTAQEDEIKKELLAMAEGKNAMGAGIKISKCMRKGSIVYSDVPELKGIDLNAYRKEPTEYWRFS